MKKKSKNVRIDELNKNILAKFDLAELFNDDCSLLKDKGKHQDLELYKDIQETKKYIEYINEKEEVYRKRHEGKKSKLKTNEDRNIDIYKKYAQKEILGLSEILRKQPMRIVLEFDKLARVGIKSSDYINDIFESDTEYRLSGKKAYKKINKLLVESSLSDLFFYLIPSWEDYKIHEQSYSSVIRTKLTAGIFDFIHRILICKGGYHIKKCKYCSQWFVCRRSNGMYCDKKCRYEYHNRRKCQGKIKVKKLEKP